MLTHEPPIKNHPNALIKNIFNWLARNWKIEIRHTYRQGNCCDDWLAGASLNLTYGLHIWDTPPLGILHVLRDDDAGVALPQYWDSLGFSLLGF